MSEPLPESLFNLADRFRERAARHPDKPACVRVRGPSRRGRTRYEITTFAQLELDADRLAAGLAAAGFARGLRTVVLVRPGADLFAVVLALLKIGANLVLIDAGMGKRRLLDCLRDVVPEAFVGIPAAHLVRKAFPRVFKRVSALATAGRRWAWGGTTLADARREGERRLAGRSFPAVRPVPGECAAILFTTGSTGPAKGVRYTHDLLEGELRRLEEVFGITPDDVDCATFPGFSLFSLLMGMTVVVPDMDPTRPGFVDPRRIVQPLRDWRCTFSFGSPALWRRVGDWCRARDSRLPTLRRVVMAGAPAGVAVHRTLCEKVLDMDAGADTWSPYGATEAMPVAVIRGSRILRETAKLTDDGAGACLGEPVADTDLAAIPVVDGPIGSWSESLRLPAGRIGELCVKGGQVTRHYYNRPVATARAKIPELAPDGREVAFWHRMGDAGYYDEDGRWWFCGRVAHRVLTPAGPLYTIPCEAIFNQHPAVARSALVGVPLSTPPPARDGDGAGEAGEAREVGDKEPRIVVELKPAAGRRPDYGRISAELLALGAANSLTAGIRTIHFHPKFPTDIRHNVKIDRDALALWAARHTAGPM